MQVQIEIEKAISQRERDLSKEFEAENRKVDTENIRLKLELEQLKNLSENEK